MAEDDCLMSWNYRIIKTTNGDETSFAIHEVYYDDAGNAATAIENAVEIVADSHEEVWLVMRDMAAALFQPALEWKDGKLSEVVK